MVSLLHLELFLSCIAISQVTIESATIFVALYNDIPDLNEDRLNSYKNLVEIEFEKSCKDKHKVQVVVDEKYDPYSSDLKKYLRTFDIIEIDAVKLGEFVKPEGINIPLVMSLDEMGIKGSIEKDMLPAAVEAMTVDEKIYGYPTLLCGNVVTSIAIGHGPVSTEECPINQGSVPLTKYKNALKTCKKNLIDSGIGTFKTLVIGKMNDRGGWYLPYIYLDGYIDKHGKSSLMKAVKDLEVHRRVDKDLCKELNWFVDLCQTQGTNENKCRDGSVPTHGVQDSIVNRESVLMFSFSEKLAEVLKRCDHRCTPHVLLASVPLGDKNIFLQFTDGLVVSKERWIAHDEDKKDAIEQFVKFFTSSSFRYKLAYGFDLNKPQVRYLLMPNKGFYETPFPSAYDPIYRDAFTFLKEAVPAPALKNKSGIQTLLETECLQPDATRLSKRRVAPRPKNEL